MSKQEAMEYIFDYLTTHNHPASPAVRQITVSGDDDGNWSVCFAYDNGESAEGRGADFAEAMGRALRAPIC